MTMPPTLRPPGDRLLVRPAKLVAPTGLAGAGALNHGTVVGLGLGNKPRDRDEPETAADDGTPELAGIRLGDIVHFGPRRGRAVRIHGDLLLILELQDVLIVER